MIIRLGFVSNSSSESFYTSTIKYKIDLRGETPASLLAKNDAELTKYLFGDTPPTCIKNNNEFDDIRAVATTKGKLIKGDWESYDSFYEPQARPRLQLDVKSALERARFFLSAMGRDATSSITMFDDDDGNMFNDDAKTNSPDPKNYTLPTALKIRQVKLRQKFLYSTPKDILKNKLKEVGLRSIYPEITDFHHYLDDDFIQSINPTLYHELTQIQHQIKSLEKKDATIIGGQFATVACIFQNLIPQKSHVDVEATHTIIGYGENEDEETGEDSETITNYKTKLDFDALQITKPAKKTTRKRSSAKKS